MADDRRDERGVSRRNFLRGAGAVAASSGLVGRQLAVADESSERADGAASGIRRYSASGQSISLRINGTPTIVSVTPDTTLLQALRESLGLTGSKEVCDRGACGACTVILDGRSVNSCMLLAIDAIGRSITTVEGLGQGGELDPVQQAFVENDACQCGFCIPGFVMRSRALLDETPKLDLDGIKQGLSGNICRCAAYAAIFAAVEQASQGGAS
jgi:aerobic-type carbon monoxide dehydrogenase small subunit (CoxS/CutS family)